MTPPSRAEWRRIVLETTVIATLGVVLGISFHYRVVLDALTGIGSAREAAPVSADYPAPASIEEARALVAGGALAVDARGREAFREGHLPGAVSLPLQDVEAEIAPFRSRVAADRTLVVYCSGSGCPDSFDLAIRLKKEGYRDVRVFEEGLPGWRDAGLPVAEGEQ